jgi:hypothetical protein
MSDKPTLLDRFRRLPRSMQWLVVAGAFIVGFLAWDGTIRPVVDRWNKEADDLQQRIGQLQRAEEQINRTRALQDAIVAIGPVELPQQRGPGGPAAGEQSPLFRVFIDVIREGGYRISDDEFQVGSAGARISSAEAQKLVPGGTRQLNLITATIDFKATPEDAIAIISDLESHPEVEGISSVRMTNPGEGDRKVTVQLTLDAWVVEERKSRGARS